MNIPTKLTQIGDLYSQGAKDDAGLSSFTLKKNGLLCFVWGAKSRSQSNSQSPTTIVTVSFRAIVLGTETVNIGDQLRNVKDKNGTLILEKGTIVQITPIIKREGYIPTKELDISLQ